MIKSIFFRALTLLGLTFVLIGCGAADPGEGGTGTPGTGPVTQADLEKIEGSIKDMIQNAKGSINTSNGHAVAMKAISILKASQPNGSCSFFGVDGLVGSTDGVATASVKTTTQYIPYKVDGKDFGGSGTFEIKVEKSAGVAAGAAAAGKFVKDSLLTYKYEKFSLDGKYSIDGTLVMKADAGTAEADLKDIEFNDPSKDGVLKLFEGETEIATIVFDKGIKFGEIKGADCVKLVAAGDKAYKAEIAIMTLKTKVTVTASAPTKFADVEMSVSKIAETKKNHTLGKNIEMLWTLLGPKNYSEIDVS